MPCNRPLFSANSKFPRMVFIGFGVAMTALNASAGDITPPNILDASSHSSVSGLESTNAGKTAIGIMADSSSDARTSRNQEKPGADAQHASVILGIGLSRQTSLNLGLHATGESALLSAPQVLDPDIKSNTKTKTQKFSGFSLMTKSTLVKTSLFRYGLGVFLESGTGSEEIMTLTRSQKPKGGFLNIFEVGDARSALLTNNLGFRYRTIEVIGDYDVRDEFFYSSILTVPFYDYISLFCGLSGRTLALREHDIQDDFHANFSVDTRVGGALKMGPAELRVFGGTPLNRRKALGQGLQVFGLNLLYNFSHTKATKQPRSANESMAKSAAPKKRSKGSSRTKESANSRDIETILDQADKDSKTLDEFELASEGQKNGSGAKSELSDEEKVTRELEDIRAAERKALQEAARRLKIEDERAQREDNDNIDKENADFDALKNEVQDDIQALPSVQDSDVQWNGLEH